jgi:two-component system OmpR family sensor kinase
MGSLILAALLGLHVRAAIAPRIANLVQMVKRFHEFGIHQRVLEQGQDEIAVLANALDVGFAAIAERDRERDRFLAIAAHELKTPMTSIQGFAQVALANPAQSARALEVIYRQTGRLARLVQDLLLAARARHKELPFHPIARDLAELARRVALEVEAAAPGHAFSVDAPMKVPLLIDEELIAHALWCMFTYASSVSDVERPIPVQVRPGNARVSVAVDIYGPTLPTADLAGVFEPFSALQYEGDIARPRAGVGLFLCREVARLHGGTLRVSNNHGVGSVLTLELPA